MKLLKKISLFIFIILNFSIPTYAENFVYILKDTCINNLYITAVEALYNNAIEVLKDPQGIIIRFSFEDPIIEYHQISSKTYKLLSQIEDFLAKIKNPVIIEVHTAKTSDYFSKNIRNWEVSTVIANNLELILLNKGRIPLNRIKSIGYGEFLPIKNTPYNGGKYVNRVDIMILCNISGE